MTVPRRVNTPKQFIHWAAEAFNEAELCFGHGTDNAHDEAAYLVLRALDLPFELEEQQLNRILDEEEKAFLAQLVRHRIESRIAVAYILNEAWFCGLPFYVDERVLIPRSPVAELISEQFVPWLDPARVKNILDLGTGSACIAIAAALAFPLASVDAVDISADALAVAEENRHRHGLARRLCLLRSDLFDSLAGQDYDLIIANPPYVATDEFDTLAEEYRHEPRLALAAGDDGLDLVRRILDEAGAYLREDGILVVEVGNSEEQLKAAFPGYPFLWLEFEFGGHGVFLLTAEQLATL